MNDAKKLSSDVREILYYLRARLVNLYGSRLEDVVLYGSRARGDDEAGSDIDVLVVLSGEVDPAAEIHRTSELLSDISLRSNLLVSCNFIDKSKLEKGRGPLVRNVLREGIRI